MMSIFSKTNLFSGFLRVNRDKNKRKKHLRKKIKILENKLCCRSLIKRINTRAISLVRSFGLFLNGTRSAGAAKYTVSISTER